jgi:hypothetical protein
MNMNTGDDCWQENTEGVQVKTFLYFILAILKRKFGSSPSGGRE